MKNSINDGHYLELTDRLHIFNSNFEDHICNHSLTKKDNEIKEITDKVSELLADLYQTVGNKMYNKNEKKQNPISQIVLGRHKKSKD